MVEPRCGLHCTECEYKGTCGCGGCIETNGHPFYGEFRGAAVGHFRNGAYDINDIVCDMQNAEGRKEEIVEAVSSVNFGKASKRFMGKSL